MKDFKFNTLRETTAPATEGQGDYDETQMAEQRLIWNLGKLGTKLEENYEKTNDRSNAENNPKPSKINPGKAPGRPQIDPSTLPEYRRTKKNHMVPQSWPKSHESRPKVGPKRPVCDPGGTPKSTKKRPRPKKALRKMAPEAVFNDFLDHLCSKSHSRSILGGSEP